MKVDTYPRQSTGVFAKPTEFVARAFQSGQAAVEFALLATLFFVVVLVGVQFAIIGQAALAVSQASYVGARAASVNTNMTNATIQSAIQNQLSPTISDNATVTMTNTTDPSCTAGPSGSRSFGCPINVTVTYDATSKLFLPSNWTILSAMGVKGGILFPTSLSATESAMTE